MAQIDILEEEVTFVPDMDADMTDEQEKARFAAEDLERIEEDAKREAEAYVEAVDGDGNEESVRRGSRHGVRLRRSGVGDGTGGGPGGSQPFRRLGQRRFRIGRGRPEPAGAAQSWSRRGFGNVAAPLLHGVRRAARSSYNKEVACIVSLSKGALP